MKSFIATFSLEFGPGLAFFYVFNFSFLIFLDFSYMDFLTVSFPGTKFREFHFKKEDVRLEKSIYGKKSTFPTYRVKQFHSTLEIGPF